MSLSAQLLFAWRPRLFQARPRAFPDYLFLSPWLVGLLALTLFPILPDFGLGFLEFGIFRRPTWVGVQNYRDILANGHLFLVALGNTLYFVTLSVPWSTVIDFRLAVALNTRLKDRTLFQTACYLPSIVHGSEASRSGQWRKAVSIRHISTETCVLDQS